MITTSRFLRSLVCTDCGLWDILKFDRGLAMYYDCKITFPACTNITCHVYNSIQLVILCTEYGLKDILGLYYFGCCEIHTHSCSGLWCNNERAFACKDSNKTDFRIVMQLTESILYLYGASPTQCHAVPSSGYCSFECKICQK